ncbi:MAG: energy transducer TonB [Proteobacteria bacterium]|nr:energy transducer TonB [Pseudomonadota bacterium]
MPAGAGTDMSQFCAHLRVPMRYYPGHARDLRIEGSTTLECALDANDRIQTCWIVSETPPHEEFGLAGLQVACRLLSVRAPAAWTPFHVDGDMRPHVRAPLDFRLNESH